MVTKKRVRLLVEVSVPADMSALNVRRAVKSLIRGDVTAIQVESAAWADKLRQAVPK